MNNGKIISSHNQLPRKRLPTCPMDVLLARVPDPGVETAEEEAVVPGLPAVVHLVLVRFVHPVVDAVVAPLLAAVGLGDALGSLAPVRGDEGGRGKEQGHQVQTHRQQRTTFPRRLHDLSSRSRPRRPEKKFIQDGRQEAAAPGQRRRGIAQLDGKHRDRRTEELRASASSPPLCPQGRMK